MKNFIAISLIPTFLLGGCVMNDVPSNDELVYNSYEFYTLPRFSGVVTKYESIGMPEDIHDYSGPILNVYIQSGDQVIIVKEFESSSTATASLDHMIGSERDDFPHCVYILRGSILFD